MAEAVEKDRLRAPLDAKTQVANSPEREKAEHHSPSMRRIRSFLAGKMGSDLDGEVKDNIYLWEPKSLRIRAINWTHVFLSAYLNYIYRSMIMLLFIFICW